MCRYFSNIRNTSNLPVLCESRQSLPYSSIAYPTALRDARNLDITGGAPVPGRRERLRETGEDRRRQAEMKRLALKVLGPWATVYTASTSFPDKEAL